MRLLLTNDDGIDSVGLHVLARAMREFGEVVIVAPDAEYSGASSAFGALHLIQPEVHRTHIDGIDEAWMVTGPPALCVMFATRFGVFGEPFDIIVSGINPGANVGRSVYHSGTIGACLTGRNAGVSGVAVSQSVTDFGVEGQGWDEMLAGQLWDTAAEVTRVVVGGLISSLPTDPVVINLNVPNAPIAELAGWQHTAVGMLPPRSMASATLEPKLGHEAAFRVKMNWGDPIELPAGTDGGAIERGLVSVSYLSRIYDADHEAARPVEGALSEVWAEM